MKESRINCCCERNCHSALHHHLLIKNGGAGLEVERTAENRTGNYRRDAKI